MKEDPKYKKVARVANATNIRMSPSTECTWLPIHLRQKQSVMLTRTGPTRTRTKLEKQGLDYNNKDLPTMYKDLQHNL